MILAKQDPAPGPIDLQEVFELGRVFSASGFFQDSRDASQAIVKIIAGRELGIGTMASMTGINVIEGKVALSANLIATLIRNHPDYDYQVTRLDGDGCEIRFTRNGQPVGTSAFTMADAQAAGLVANTVYKSFSRNMLFARAMSNGARWYCPDVFNGAPPYTPEELGAKVDGEGQVIELPTEAAREVETQPGEVRESPQHRTRGTQAATQAVRGAEAGVSFGQAALEQPSQNAVNQAKHSVRASLQAIGYPEPAKPLAYLNRALGTTYAKRAEVPGGSWVLLAYQLDQAENDRRACLALWGRLATRDGFAGQDRPLRLATWGGYVGRTLETSGDLVPAEWSLLRATLSEAAASAAEVPSASAPTSSDCPIGAK